MRSEERACGYSHPCATSMASPPLARDQISKISLRGIRRRKPRVTVPGEVLDPSFISSSPTASRSNCASRARATIWSTRSSHGRKARTISLIVRRVEALANSSIPRTARTCSPATSAPPTSSASRRRRTRANMSASPTLCSTARTKNGRCRGRSTPPRRRRVPRSRARTSRPPCAPWRSSAPCRRLLRQGDGQRRRGRRQGEAGENRLKLLNEIREATRAVADFSRIEGA